MKNLVLPPGAGAKPAPFHCPTCKTENPPYGFHLNRADLGIVGYIEYCTAYCVAAKKNPTATSAPGEPAEICGAILSVNVLTYVPPTDPELRKQLMAAMMRGQGGGQA